MSTEEAVSKLNKRLKEMKEKGLLRDDILERFRAAKDKAPRETKNKE